MILLISDINDKHTYNKLYEVSMQSNELEFQRILILEYIVYL